MVDPLQQEILAAISRRVNGPVRLEDSMALLGIDSVGMADLSFELERAYGVDLEEDVVFCETVADLVKYVRDRLNAGEAGDSMNPRIPR